LIAEHLGGASPAKTIVLPPEPATVDQLDLAALSEEQIERLLGAETVETTGQTAPVILA